MVDPDRVRRLLTALERYHSELVDLAATPREQYLATQVYAGRYLVQAAAQVCIDVALHVIASEGWGPPATFRDSFAVLADHEVILQSLAVRLQNLTGLRNRLVHLYDDVDDALVHDALAEGLGDLRAFAQAIGALARRPD